MNTKTKERTASLNMRCTERTKNGLESLSAVSGKTMSEIIDDLIQRELDRVFVIKKRAVK